MTDDDLRQPLRRRNWKDRLRASRPTPLRAATFVVIATTFGLGTWLYANDDPHLGEPVVHLKIAPVDPIDTASLSPADAGKATSGTASDDESSSASSIPDDSIPAEDLETTETASAVIVAPRIRLAPAPVAGYFESGPDGALPKISVGGRRPFDIYARPVHKTILQSSQPKIALIIGGMGLNADLTDRAIKELPPEVTFAFAPYGEDLQRTINRARSAGHEVMLHLPMEPFGYPGSNPGPHTLLVSAKTDENMMSLTWLLSRFSGYTGVVNYLGARFTTDQTSLEPVLRQLKARGLVYLDDGSSTRSLAADIGGEIGLPVRQSALVIDAGGDFNSTLDNLHKLESMNNSGNIVIGMGTGLSSTMDAVETWAKDLDSRGILLVPVSAGFRSGTH